MCSGIALLWVNFTHITARSRTSNACPSVSVRRLPLSLGYPLYAPFISLHRLDVYIKKDFKPPLSRAAQTACMAGSHFETSRALAAHDCQPQADPSSSLPTSKLWPHATPHPSFD
jgi:hypothetical protein